MQGVEITYLIDPDTRTYDKRLKQISDRGAKKPQVIKDVRQALSNPDFTLSQLRYDLGKLRGKGLVVRMAGTQCYQLTPEGYQLAVLYQKLYHRLYAPLTAAILTPDSADGPVPNRRRAKVDRLYEAVSQALNKLTQEIGVAA